MIAIGEIIKNGVTFDMKNWNKNLENVDKLPEIVDHLLTQLSKHKINYLRVGGIAVLSYVEG